MHLTGNTFQVWDAVNGGSMTASIRGDGSAAFDGAVATGYGASGTWTTINPSGQLFMQTSGTAIQNVKRPLPVTRWLWLLATMAAPRLLALFNLVEIHGKALLQE